MDIRKSPQGYRPPEAFFEAIQNNPQNNFQKVQKALGRGIVEGLGAVRDAVDGDVTIETGFAFDYLGRVINVDEDFILDFSGITRPAAGYYRYVTAVADYNQVEEGSVQDDLGNEFWEEKQESIAIRFIEGDEAASEAAAVKPAVDSGDVVLVDMMFDNASSGCLSIDTDRKSFSGQKVYLQLPGMGDPTEEGFPGIWTNISSSFAGDFFRVEGGNALAFNAGRQNDALLRVTGSFTTRNTASGGDVVTGFTGAFSDGGDNSGTITVGTDSANQNRRIINFDNADSVSPNASKTDDDETRSVNQTIRVWKRTA